MLVLVKQSKMLKINKVALLGHYQMSRFAQCYTDFYGMTRTERDVKDFRI